MTGKRNCFSRPIRLSRQFTATAVALRDCDRSKPSHRRCSERGRLRQLGCQSQRSSPPYCAPPFRGKSHPLTITGYDNSPRRDCLNAKVRNSMQRAQSRQALCRRHSDPPTERNDGFQICSAAAMSRAGKYRHKRITGPAGCSPRNARSLERTRSRSSVTPGCWQA